MLTGIASGQSTEDALFGRTVLFRVTSSNSRVTSYLFGTHHAFGESFFESCSNAGDFLSSCDILIKENLSDAGPTAEEIINARTTTTKWSRYLSKKDLATVEAIFAKSPTDFNKMTPTEMYVFLNRHFKQKVCLARSAADTSLTLDDHIGFKAEQQGKRIIGLETTREQIELINKDVEGMPRKRHKQRLAGIIERITAKGENGCEETDWYAKMEIDYQLEEPCRNTLLLTDRNNKWMQTITGLLETNSCFIAVGLSHLMYDCGLIKQLEALGYTITPISVRE